MIHLYIQFVSAFYKVCSVCYKVSEDMEFQLGDEKLSRNEWSETLS